MAAAYFLAKTEPGSYSIDDLQRDGTTYWDGVKNPQAVKAILLMRPGDRVFLHHTGGISAIAGLAEVATGGRSDPKNEKSAVADFKYLTHLTPPVTLAEIKESGLFSDFALVRQSRLSTMAVPNAFVEWMRKRYAKVDI